MLMHNKQKWLLYISIYKSFQNVIVIEVSISCPSNGQYLGSLLSHTLHVDCTYTSIN